MSRFLTLILLITLFVVEPVQAKRKKRATPAKPALSEETTRTPATEGALQRLLVIEDLRLSKDPFLLSSLRSHSPRIAKQAFITLGRIGDPSGIEDAKRVLDRRKGDREVKQAAAFALGLINDPTAVKVAAQNIALQKDPEVVADLLLSVGRQGNEKNIESISAMLKEEFDPRVRESAAHALGMLWGAGSDKWPVPPDTLPRLAAMLTSAEPLALASAFALARFKGDVTLYPAPEILAATAKTPWPEVKALLCRALGKIRTAPSAAFLAGSGATDAYLGVRVEAIKALAAHTMTEPILTALRRALADPMAVVQWQALETAGIHGVFATTLAESVDNLFRASPSTWIKGAALKCLAKIQPVIARQRIGEILGVAGSPLLPAAVSALGTLGSGDDLEKLAKYITHEDIKVAGEALEALNALAEDRIPSSAKAAVKKAIERADTALSSLAAQLVEKHKWKDFAGAIAAVYPSFTLNDQLEAKVALLNALGAVGDRSHVPLVEGAMKDTERLVVAAAAGALKALTGKDESAKIPLNSKIVAVPPSLPEAMAATKKRVVLETSKGEIHLKLSEETPLTSLNFVRLVKQHGMLKKSFYDGKIFHRIVPNFVSQGGDPRGDGYGGPGYLIRDEVSNRVHVRGTVGIATAGKDTGGCQFFINLAPNLHLDGKYTLFAEVTKGMDVADRLEAGDRILSARFAK